MDAPELDYAYLADFAQVVDNKLTAVGASCTFLSVSTFPLQHALHIAGRIRTPEADPHAAMTLKVVGPENTVELEGSFHLSVDRSIRPYDGKVGLLFAVGLNMPLPEPGLYTVDLFLDEEHVRRLAFEAHLVGA